MSRKLMMLVVLASAVGLSVAHAGQGPLQLRYQPPLGSAPPMTAEIRLKLIWIGLPSLPDSTPVEVNDRMLINLRVVERKGPQNLIQWTYDSARVRVRIGGGARNEVSLPTV